MMSAEYFIFEVRSFCVMNQKERLCRSHLEEISCFKMEIPYRFESSETIDRYCSVNFPPGYSIYVEDFFMDQTRPDNFVLLDGKPLQYSSKLKWVDRRQKFLDGMVQLFSLRLCQEFRGSFISMLWLKTSAYAKFGKSSKDDLKLL